MLHLARRFFGHLRARPLSPGEQETVRSTLTPELRRLFYSQPYQDQRHAFEVMARLESDSKDAVQAALLHDVGKARSRIGPFQRSFATIARMLGVPVPHRWRLYLDHGAIGSRMLADAGASEFVVAFTGAHPGSAQPGFDSDAWSAVARADEA